MDSHSAHRHHRTERDVSRDITHFSREYKRHLRAIMIWSALGGACVTVLVIAVVLLLSRYVFPVS